MMVCFNCLDQRSDFTSKQSKALFRPDDLLRQQDFADGLHNSQWRPSWRLQYWEPGMRASISRQVMPVYRAFVVRIPQVLVYVGLKRCLHHLQKQEACILGCACMCVQFSPPWCRWPPCPPLIRRTILTLRVQVPNQKVSAQNHDYNS